jgi:hypothetical protein
MKKAEQGDPTRRGPSKNRAWWKRHTNRLARRAARRDPEGPTRRVFWGYWS